MSAGSARWQTSAVTTRTWRAFNVEGSLEITWYLWGMEDIRMGGGAMVHGCAEMQRTQDTKGCSTNGKP